MSVNINVLKEIDKNQKEVTDIKVKTKKVTDATMYVQKGYSESALQ